MARMKMWVALALVAVVGLGSLPAMAATSAAKPEAKSGASKNAVHKPSTVTKKKTTKTAKAAKPHAVAAGKKKPAAAKTAHQPA